MLPLSRIVVKPLLLLLAALPLVGQTFYGAGVSPLPQSSPKPTGWATVATLAKGRIWSISEIDFTRVQRGLVQSSVRTGVATPLRSFGPVALFIMADAGAATTGANLSAAFGTGPIAIIPLGKNGWSVLVGFRAVQSGVGGLQQTVEIGFGKTLP